MASERAGSKRFFEGDAGMDRALQAGERLAALLLDFGVNRLRHAAFQGRLSRA
jgi:hypothetical protein